MEFLKRKPKSRKLIRIFQKKLTDNLIKNKEELIEYLKKDWEAIEGQARKEKIIREAKEAAVVSAKIILKLAVIGGVCTAVLVAPKIFAIASPSGRYKKYANRKGTLENFYYLKRQNYITLNKIDNEHYEIKITDKGLARVLGDSFNLSNLYFNRKWDGKWRIIIFDIPEKFKSAREAFRNKLIQIGFYKIQDSVFITPYPCEKEVIFISEIFNISPFIYFIESGYFIDDKFIKQHFNLK